MALVHTHTHIHRYIPWDASSQKWDSPEQHQPSTSSAAPRATEQLPPLNYSPPVNCHVNIHLRAGRTFQPVACMKITGPVNQPSDKSMLRDVKKRKERRLERSWNVNAPLPQENKERKEGGGGGVTANICMRCGNKKSRPHCYCCCCLVNAYGWRLETCAVHALEASKQIIIGDDEDGVFSRRPTWKHLLVGELKCKWEPYLL